MTGFVEVRDLRPEEIPEAVGVLARGMRDNPLHVAAYGDDPERRLRRHARLMRGMLRAFKSQRPICAVRDGTLVGVTGVAGPEEQDGQPAGSDYKSKYGLE
jgi:hypothetical protein